MKCEAVNALAAGLVYAVVSTGVAYAQAVPSRVEVGGHVNVLRLSDSSDTNVGVGGRVTVNLAPWLAVEGELQWTPSDVLSDTSVVPGGGTAGIRYERRRTTGLFGVKAGYRGERFGIFGKVRPGVTSLSDRGVECLGEVCALILLAVPEYRQELAVDLGGVVEFYPSARWLIRGDVGSLLIRHRSTAPPCGAGDCRTSNLASSIGVGVRF